MNTDKVKNIVIAALSALTILFVALIYFDEQSYVLSNAQEENIVSILERNDFELASWVSLPRYFAPMRPLAMQWLGHDVPAIVTRFFDGIAYEEDNEIGWTFYYCDINEKEIGINIANNVINFSSLFGFVAEGYEGFIHGAAGAKELAYAFIHDIIAVEGMEHHATTLTAAGDYILTFYERHEGHIIFNNHVRVRVAPQGIVHVVYSSISIGEFVEYEGPIFSADEALLALVSHLRAEHEYHQDILITDIQLVYASQERGVPAYLFTVVIGGQITFNYLFNAFTNMHMWSEIVF